MAMLVVISAQVPAKSVAEVIALAKAKPGSISFASSGSGGAPHLVGELFKTVTGAPIQHVPYKGSAPGAADVAGGQVQLIDRKSTRLNSSHQIISYAVFCLKKKKIITESATH